MTPTVGVAEGQGVQGTREGEIAGGKRNIRMEEMVECQGLFLLLVFPHLTRLH